MRTARWKWLRATLLCLAVAAFSVCAVGQALAAEEAGSSCLEPAKGPTGAAMQAQAQAVSNPATAPQAPVMARVGHEAPDFEALAYQDGGFKRVKLSDYKGSWVVLCFYPGDYTFV